MTINNAANMRCPHRLKNPATNPHSLAYQPTPTHRHATSPPSCDTTLQHQPRHRHSPPQATPGVRKPTIQVQREHLRMKSCCTSRRRCGRPSEDHGATDVVRESTDSETRRAHAPGMARAERRHAPEIMSKRWLLTIPRHPAKPPSPTFSCSSSATTKARVAASPRGGAKPTERPSDRHTVPSRQKRIATVPEPRLCGQVRRPCSAPVASLGAGMVALRRSCLPGWKFSLHQAT